MIMISTFFKRTMETSLKILLLLSVLMHASVSKGLSELCKMKKELICTGHYDAFKYREICTEQSGCIGKFNKQCSPNYCSIRKNCHRYFQTFNLFGVIQSRYISERTNDCPSDNVFQPNDACKNGRNCKLNVSHVKQNRTIPMRCHCPESHSFECGHHFCTINNKACETLKHLDKALNFKSCHNSGQTMYKRVRVYIF